MNYRRQRMPSSSTFSSSGLTVPLGMAAVRNAAHRCCPRVHCINRNFFRISTFILTYLAYTCYHMSRKPISVVKSVLHNNCTANESLHSTVSLLNSSPANLPASSTAGNIFPSISSQNCGYAPFDDANAATLFALLDSAFLFSYAGAMFISGFVAERVSLRYFLASGMIVSGVFSYLFGMAKEWDIHSIGYFIFVQAGAGIAQTTGWPGVVTLIGRWFGKSKRGLIFGIWNSHTSIGNILGTVIAAEYVETNWAYSFIVPGFLIAFCGFILFLFVIDSPEMVGCQTMDRGRSSIIGGEYHETHSRLEDDGNDIERDDANLSRPTERTPILEGSGFHSAIQRPIKLIDALRIPGVVEFSLCLFFSKLVSYTFLYWLPLYIQSSSTFGPSLSADISILFDVGGIFGAIAAGMVSDYTGMSATTCTVMLFLAPPVLLIYQLFGYTSVILNVYLLLLAGFLVNGPYALITTSVSAELGQHSSLEGNAKALATVTAIIDGTGSIGAAVGPLMAGMISNRGWQNVFHMLIVSDILAMLLLVRLVKKEYHRLRRFARIRIE